MMRVTIDPTSLDDYQSFLKIKKLPQYRFEGHTAIFPDEYASRLKMPAVAAQAVSYKPLPALFDYQQDITKLAIGKRKFAVFADCGLGKTLIFLEFARYAATQISPHKTVMIVSPLMVIPQTLREAVDSTDARSSRSTTTRR